MRTNGLEIDRVSDGVRITIADYIIVDVNWTRLVPLLCGYLAADMESADLAPPQTPWLPYRLFIRLVEAGLSRHSSI